MIILFNEGFDQEFGNEKILIEKSFLEKVIVVMLHYIMKKGHRILVLRALEIGS